MGSEPPAPKAGRVGEKLCPGGYFLEPGGSGDEDLPPHTEGGSGAELLPHTSREGGGEELPGKW